MCRTSCASVRPISCRCCRIRNTYFYVCGLKSMEEGVVLALRDIAQAAQLPWETVAAALKAEGRLHLETY